MGRSLDAVGSVRVRQEGGAERSGLGRSSSSSWLDGKAAAADGSCHCAAGQSSSFQQPLGCTIPPVVKSTTLLIAQRLLVVCLLHTADTFFNCVIFLSCTYIVLPSTHFIFDVVVYVFFYILCCLGRIHFPVGINDVIVNLESWKKCSSEWKKECIKSQRWAGITVWPYLLLEVLYVRVPTQKHALCKNKENKSSCCDSLIHSHQQTNSSFQLESTCFWLERERAQTPSGCKPTVTLQLNK